MLSKYWAANDRAKGEKKLSSPNQPSIGKGTNCRSGNWPRFWGQIWCRKRVFSVCMCSLKWIRVVCICPASWPGVKNTIADLCVQVSQTIIAVCLLWWFWPPILQHVFSSAQYNIFIYHFHAKTLKDIHLEIHTTIYIYIFISIEFPFSLPFCDSPWQEARLRWLLGPQHLRMWMQLLRRCGEYWQLVMLPGGVGSWLVGLFRGHSKRNHVWGGIKQYKSMVNFKDFPFLQWNVWVGNNDDLCWFGGVVGSDSHWLRRPTRLEMTWVLFFFGDAWNQLRMCVVKQKDGWKGNKKDICKGDFKWRPNHWQSAEFLCLEMYPFPKRNFPRF